MLSKFVSSIKKTIPLNHNVIAAVSGGVDSMVLCDLLLKSEINFSIAHINYMLRGIDSDQDESFVKTYCTKNKIKFFSKSYDLSNSKSIQKKARELRYDFFTFLSLKYNYTHIMTAHHLDDNIETVLINIYRGKKLNPLTGIKQINNTIVRPLLSFTKDDIVNYAKKNKLTWREDKSNFENKYLRNKIRNIIIPKIKLADPCYRTNFIRLINESNKLKVNNDKYLEIINSEYFIERKDGIIESKKSNWKNCNLKSVEFIAFRKYGFFKNSEILKILIAETGKKITSKSHEILSDRNKILIKKISHHNFKEYNLTLGKNQHPFQIKLEKCNFSKKPSKNMICIHNKVSTPLKVRRFKKGDIFYPYGMNGKKKVSKFFKDEKLSIFEKQNKWLLTDAKNQVLWIIGMRVDRRLLKTKGKCLKISI